MFYGSVPLQDGVGTWVNKLLHDEKRSNLFCRPTIYVVKVPYGRRPGRAADVEERAAVECLKRGDIGGLEALLRKYHTRAGRTAYLIVRDHALAEDVAQGAFVRAYERIGGFDAERPFDYPGLTESQVVRSEDRVSGSDRKLKTCADRRMVASGFEQ